MPKYLDFFVNAVTISAIALITSLSIVAPALAVTQELQFNTDRGYLIKTTFSYDESKQPKVIHEQGAGTTQTIDSMQVSFYKPSGELMARYDNIVDGVAQGSYFEFNFEPQTQQLLGNVDLGGESVGEMYLKGEANQELSLIEVEASGAEKAIARVRKNK